MRLFRVEGTIKVWWTENNENFSICGHEMNAHEKRRRENLERRSWFASDAIKKLFSLRASHNRHTNCTARRSSFFLLAACLQWRKGEKYLEKICVWILIEGRKKSEKTPFLSNFIESFLAVSVDECLRGEKWTGLIHYLGNYSTRMKQFLACNVWLCVRKIGCRNSDCLRKICIISLEF